MQKKLIALAIAGLASSAAFAQSNVTVYGVADVYVSTASTTGVGSRTGVNSSGLAGSRLGFKGVEDLGNGTKALFTLEYALATDSNTGVGTGAAAARQQFVGLTGGFGTAVAGRLQTAGYDFSAATNALHGTALNALDRVSANGTAGALGLINSSSRASNAVAYISPSFGGVTVAYNHARVTEGAAFGSANGTSDSLANLLSATFVQGPVTASAIYTKINGSASTAGVGGVGAGVKEWAIGGAYDFGVATVKASYLTRKVEAAAAANTDKAWQVSGIVPVSSVGKVVVGYAQSKLDSTAADDNGKSLTVAYLHSLSKRTTAYAGYQHVKNQSAGTATTALITSADATIIGGSSSRALVAGVNHSF